MTPSLGKRIATLRAQLGWTQQELADRVGMSRVALSNMEVGVTVPGERTVALLAGIFKVEPHELVAGTGYPIAKAERLPVVVTRYTETELQLRLLQLDLEHGLEPSQRDEWAQRLKVLAKDAHDRREAEAIVAALEGLHPAKSSPGVVGGSRRSPPPPARPG